MHPSYRFLTNRRTIKTLSQQSCQRASSLYPESNCRCFPDPLAGLADRALHLELDEPVHLDGELHRKLFDDRLDKSAHHHA